MSVTNKPESGTLPGRIEFVPEPSLMEMPTDPEWERFSDVMRSFSAAPGASYSAQNSIGTPDAVDHNRGTEDPSCAVGYDLQRFFVDSNGDPLDASGYGILRDAQNQLVGSHTIVERQDHGDTRLYTVVRGAKVETVEPELDPTVENPILMELTYAPRKVRTYRIEQPESSSTLDIVSTNANDTMDITIENEDASTTETITLTGDTSVTTTESFGDIDAVWLSDNPEGDVTISDGSGNDLMEIDGGLSYSDDDQPVDGDRGVPALGAGSHATEIGTNFEHFVGDRFERPTGDAVRDRVNSAGWSVENDMEDSAVNTSRLPTIDEGNRTVSIEADVAGQYVSHESMVEHLTKSQHNLEHELSGGTVTFNNTVPTDSVERTREADQAVLAESETFEASGDPAIEVTASA